MNAYRITMLVIDHEESGPADAVSSLESARHVNASVLSVESADIGEWDDDHPLNSTEEQAGEIARLPWSRVEIVKW